jgi:hypothetical protein
MTRRAQREAILAAGLVGTFFVVLGGVGSLASRVWSTSFTQTLEVMVAAPFLAAWVLAPLFWAVRPGARRTDGLDERPASVLAAIVLVGLGVAGYGSIFVARPLMTGEPLGIPALYTALLVPGLQWVTVAAGYRLMRSGTPDSG